VTRRRARPECATPGCTNEASYATRMGAPWPRLPVVRCAECTWGIARWIAARWREARMEVVPL